MDVIEVGKDEESDRPPKRMLDGQDVNPLTGRLLSIAELQQLLQAQMTSSSGPATAGRASMKEARDHRDRADAWANPGHQRRDGHGLPGSAATPDAGYPVTPPVTSRSTSPVTPLVTKLVTAPVTPADGGGHDGHVTRPPAAPLPWPYVLVVGAQPGDGCSVTALGLAEAAGQSRQVHLIETPHGIKPAGTAAPARPSSLASGLIAVTQHELGLVGNGWQRGRRGDLIIDRVTPGNVAVQHWPPAAPATTLLSSMGLLVVDGGPLTDGRPWWANTVQSNWPVAVVLVCRSTVEGVAAAEHAAGVLQRLRPSHPGQGPGTSHDVVSAVASVGGARWRATVTDASGPVLTQLLTDRRVIGIPFSRRLDAGPTTAPLPRGVASGTRRLWDLLASHLDSQSPSSFWAASPARPGPPAAERLHQPISPLNVFSKETL